MVKPFLKGLARAMMSPTTRPSSGDRLPASFHWLIAAQFSSALADNALLIIAIALLQLQGYPGWWAPMLKFAFTVSYVVLAPIVGPLADAFPKARLMAWMNGLKVLGVLGMVLGLHPVAAFGIIGLGAAAYAPAKYGLVTELVPAHRLVVANGWIEVSVVCAALLGTALGGGLVCAWWLDTAWVAQAESDLAAVGLGSAQQLAPSLVALLLVYALAGLLNLGVADSGVRYPAVQLCWRSLVKDFWLSNARLWNDPWGGRLSLSVTTLFWGVGATLQFAVLRWATEQMGLPLDKAAQLQVAVALGVVVGAVLAANLVHLRAAHRVLPAGVLLGALIATVGWSQGLWLAVAMLAAVGATAGFLVVPLNALLQHRGSALLSAGRSIAVQGFNENLSILLMLAAYTGLIAMDLPIAVMMSGLGLAIAAFMARMVVYQRRLA